MNADTVLTAADAEQLMTIADDLEQLAEAIRWRAVKGAWASQLSGTAQKLTKLNRTLDQMICG